MNCNLVVNIFSIYLYIVSIPNRDFDELQFWLVSLLSFNFKVSIPNRDFDELQFVVALVVSALNSVSIPNRDFDELQSLSCWNGDGSNRSRFNP